MEREGHCQQPAPPNTVGLMRLSRTIARPLVAAIFIASGLEVLANPEPRAKVAKPVVDRVASVVPFAPSDPLDADRHLRWAAGRCARLNGTSWRRARFLI